MYIVGSMYKIEEYIKYTFYFIFKIKIANKYI